MRIRQPNQLYRRGVKKTDLPVGAEVTVTGFLAKDGTTTMNATSVTLADGRQLFAGSSAPALLLSEERPRICSKLAPVPFSVTGAFVHHLPAGGSPISSD